MNIKVQCSCQAKFSFDVEPVDGKMPVNIVCPACGADTTDLANQAIQANLPASDTGAGASSVVAKPVMRLKVAQSIGPAFQRCFGPPEKTRCSI